MRFSIVDRGDDNSKRVAETLKKKCIDIGWEYDDEKSEVIFSVGGDGTLLRAIHTYIDRLDEIQFVAIHTGNLGFFTDYTQDEVDHLVYDLKHNQPKIEEFNLLQAALNIEDGIEGLRYNKVIVATDADVDGMHIRLLIITFFLQFFPDLIKKGHVYILQTPLFRVRNKKKTSYCYTEDERVKAIEELGPNPEITRFKGLGEISPDEFRHFIGKDMRLEQVSLRKTDLVKELLEFYMGKNTMERQNFIIDNLVIEEDLAS